jgi:predicted Zn-dependent protease with MMP-like domain
MKKPYDIDAAYEKLEQYWKGNQLGEAIKVAEGAARNAPYSHEPELWLGDLYFEMDEWDRALKHYLKALEMEPELIEAMTGASKIYFEKCRFSDAEKLVDEALMNDPENGEANYQKALILERKKDFTRADKFLSKAHKSDPEYYPSTFKIKRKEFDRSVGDVLDGFTETLHGFIKDQNIAVITEDVPDNNDLLASDPPLSPHILGLYRGSSTQDRSFDSAWSMLPNQVVLYQRNLEHFCQDREELKEQIWVTLMHEIGHGLGYNEADLEKRGLD